MPNDPMTLIDRLRNPAWVHVAGGVSLNVEKTRTDMYEAANEIERLQRELVDANSYADLRAAGGIVNAP